MRMEFHTSLMKDPMFVRMRTDFKEALKTDLDAFIEEIDNNFVDFRYAYEGAGRSFYGYPQILNAIKECILQLVPDLAKQVAKGSNLLALVNLDPRTQKYC